MDILGLAVRNLARRPSRTALVVVGIAVSCASVIAMLSITRSMAAKVNSDLEQYGANIVVVPSSRTLDVRFGGMEVGGLAVGELDIDAAAFANVWKIKDRASLAHVSPKVYAPVPLGGGRGQVTLAGIDMAEEPEVKRWWKLNGTYPSSPGEVLLGAGLADSARLWLGNAVDIGGRNFTVSGILHPTGSADDGMAFIELGTAQAMLGKEGRYSMVDIRGWCHLCPVEEMVRQIMEAVPGVRATPVKQVAMAEVAVLDSIRRFSTVISGVIVALSLLGLGGLILSSVNERIREIGILMALGFKERQVGRLVMSEGALVGLIGGLGGFFLGAAIAAALGPSIAGGPMARDPMVLPPWYLLSLDDVPTSVDGRLQRVLEASLGVGWAGAATIEKVEGGDIVIASGDDWIRISLAGDGSAATLRASDGSSRELIVGEEGGSRNVYVPRADGKAMDAQLAVGGVPLMLLPASLGLALAVTLTSSIYPAHRAARLHPAAALRSL